MKTTKMLTILVLGFGLMVWLVPKAEAESMGTAFTYQGRLMEREQSAEGLYDLEFKLFDGPADGNQSGGTVEANDVDVIDGYFTVELDFGSAFDGDARWLEIGVRPGVENDPCEYTPLSPRQKVTAAPYAFYAKTASSDGDWTVSGDNMYSAVSGNVGIGTMSPNYRLHVEGKSISGINSSADGTYATVSGGMGNNASNYASNVGGGEYNVASGTNSVVSGGSYNDATGSNSTVPGGRDNIASGIFSTAIGLNSNAESFASVALGRFNVGGGTPDSWIATDPIFEIGIGATSAARTNAITVLKNGNVGIGTTNPGEKLEVAGNLVAGNLKVTGAYKGNISSSSGSDGAPFPRPAYDSGWVTITAGGPGVTLTHNIGGNVDNYVVDMQFKGSLYGINNRNHGGDSFWGGTAMVYQGAIYRDLGTNTITVQRDSGDNGVEEVRVRIWVYN